MTELEDMEEIVGNFGMIWRKKEMTRDEEEIVDKFAAARDLYFKTMEKARAKADSEYHKAQSEANEKFLEAIDKINAEYDEADTKATTALAKIIAKEK